MNSEKYVAHRYQQQTNHNVAIKDGEEPVKVGSLLGLEQVGQCIFIEYKDDIILVDAGMEFAANETM
jgi:mRNA degradation ribonuclease J1/J2